jgi:hypothetical protein
VDSPGTVAPSSRRGGPRQPGFDRWVEFAERRERYAQKAGAVPRDSSDGGRRQCAGSRCSRRREERRPTSGPRCARSREVPLIVGLLDTLRSPRLNSAAIHRRRLAVRALVVLAAIGGALAGAHPTGLAAADVVFTAVLAGGVTAFASWARRWTWAAAAGIALSASGQDTALFLIALAVFAAAVATSALSIRNRAPHGARRDSHPRACPRRAPTSPVLGVARAGGVPPRVHRGGAGRGREPRSWARRRGGGAPDRHRRRAHVGPRHGRRRRRVGRTDAAVEAARA